MRDYAAALHPDGGGLIPAGISTSMIVQHLKQVEARIGKKYTPQEPHFVIFKIDSTDLKEQVGFDKQGHPIGHTDFGNLEATIMSDMGTQQQIDKYFSMYKPLRRSSDTGVPYSEQDKTLLVEVFTSQRAAVEASHTKAKADLETMEREVSN